MRATIKGKKDVTIKQVNGQIIQYTLESVKYCKQIKVNLFSLTSVLSKSENLSSDDQNNISMKQDSMKIVFDWWINTHDDWLCQVDVLPCEVQSVESANQNVDSIMMGEAGMRQRN